MLASFQIAASNFWSRTQLGRGQSGLTGDQEAELRAMQIRGILSLTPAMIVSNLFNAFIVDLMFWHTSHRAFLIGWTVVMAGCLGVWYNSWVTARRKGGRQRASARGTRHIALQSMVFGTMWALPTVVMFNSSSDELRVLLATLSVGMISGGALALTSVWQAAFLFALVIEIPTVAILLASGKPGYIGLAVLSVPLSLLIARAVIENARLFAQSFVTSLKLRDQGQVISLLLKEFEENSSDWLFEIDQKGHLTNVSPRLAMVLGKPAEKLNGLPVGNILLSASTAAGKTRPPNLVALSRAIRQRIAFRNLVVPVFVAGKERWWSLSAKPLLDETCTFLGYRGVGSDLTATKEAESSMERMARYDSLTGLPNRNLLNLRLQNSIAQLNEGGKKFALLTMDLDRFKNVNDTLGHPVGDLLLMEAARRINAMLRYSDIVARFGGDEFVILQANIRQPADAGNFADRLVKAIGAPYEINGQRILIGASIGVAIAPQNGTDADTLMRNSDLALYRAKADGKGRYRFFAAEMDAASQARRIIELELRDALEKNLLEVYFQPLIDVSSGTISACEALVRWNHPQRGFISPVEFIPIAEETGMIVALGEYVLRNACKEAASWTRDIRIAVNLSAVQFRSGDLVELVSRVLAETQLPASRLELEITESILIDDKDEVLKTLNALRGLGLRISLDDFGTGYSSLAYLSSFPFDKIKIDRSFVQDVTSRPDSAAIVRAITSLAATLGMSTTAEGVESVAELNWLRDQGCDEVQGYLFSVPVPAHDLVKLLGLKTGYETSKATEVKRVA